MKQQQLHVYIFRSILIIMLFVTLHLTTTPIIYPVVYLINDKFCHLLAFYVLALLADFSFPNSGYLLHKFIPLLGYGILIEIIQSYLPNRFFSIFDVGADVFGLIMYGISLPLIKRVPVLKQRWKSE